MTVLSATKKHKVDDFRKIIKNFKKLSDQPYQDVLDLSGIHLNGFDQLFWELIVKLISLFPKIESIDLSSKSILNIDCETGIIGIKFLSQSFRFLKLLKRINLFSTLISNE